ncbi:THUMP-like domain-containing protein [Flavobacterium nackdongense]|uniref:Class I SAM-dependent methyltransferase n=1 Tax=Flavobacterium nackdongense TaxID=2547394 RepID=A0A4P6YH86_9FLAO|nr:class I SAM-dependent methyltransferase [Flavobacterium nackdongense]QBN20294.1 class I SAM-dependent methyltransferase [Flavobacterium nackdongense]
MDFKLLHPEIQDFIDKNRDATITKLALQKNPFPKVDWIAILQQIEAKTKVKDKLPTWFRAKNILYPSKISVEQTSSEKTASYKSQIVSGESLIDLTGGFGVDDFYFSKRINKIAHCEINADLSAIVQHNFEQLDVRNIQCYTGDSLAILVELSAIWDWIYIDPSRRNDAKGKVFMLQDCLPNIPENLGRLFNFSNQILIKTAPLLDITAGLAELTNVKAIHIVALDNEVKELLWEIQKGYIEKTTIKTVNIAKEKQDVFEFVMDENLISPDYGSPQKYLYEPNSAIMKSGGFDEVSIIFKLKKLHKHSHLYTNSEIIDFPGRIFEIENTLNYNKAEMKNYIEGKKFNITTRNFPETVENLRKKWKVKEGGNQYCFFTTDENDNKIVLICKKIK